MITKNSPEWKTIIKNQEQWFSPVNMKFWGSRIYWQTLTAVENGLWLFITAEDDMRRENRLYSVRLVSLDGIIDTLSWQNHATLDEAKEQMLDFKNIYDFAGKVNA